LLGYALGRRLVSRVLAIGAAPVIGWSVHCAATLPIYLLFSQVGAGYLVRHDEARDYHNR
jgi:hypothetical protein